MASSKEYLDFILEQLSELNDITYKAMYEELPAPKTKKNKSIFTSDNVSTTQIITKTS